MTGPDGDDALERADALRRTAGAYARPLRQLVALLTEGPLPLAGLIQASALSRRGVEELLDAVRTDLVEDGAGLRLRPDVVPAYRERFGYTQLRQTTPADPLAARLAENSALVADVAGLVAAAPRPRAALDHVPATPETVVRRALWLDATFDLTGARVLFVGDHDLTALALTRLNPACAATVVDVDERLLSFVDEQAGPGGSSGVRCLYADLRFGLPASITGQADLAVTDPPYTPDGVRLFVDAGLRGLRDRDSGRVVLAYGFGERHPALGLKVQQALGARHLVFEAILPDFNRYAGGAQAIGSASDLYVVRPTARTWRVLDDSGVSRGEANIYTHGPQSLEGAGERGADAVAAVTELAVGADALPLAAVVTPDSDPQWTVPATRSAARVRLGTVIGGGLPPVVARRGRFGVVADLADDPGSWLLRVLLAANADRLALLVPNAHPDVVDERAQHAVADLVAPKWSLRWHRNTPDSRTAVVVATAAPASTDPGVRLVRRLLDRAHGKLGNVWRDGLVAARRDGLVPALTRNQARARVEAATPRADLLDLTVMELPRHLLPDVLAAVAGSVTAG